MHSSRSCSPGIRQTQIHHSREHVSTAAESNGSELYTPPADAWHSTW
jgi:hypothetical protein